MKTRSACGSWPIWLAVALGATLPLAAAPAPPAQPKPPRSVFTIPHNPREGCDPFFPDSTRVYETAGPAKSIAAEVPLTFNGISGWPGHLLAIINNHTFGTGDTGQVQTVHGRVRLHCLAIGANWVLVAVNGQPRKLYFERKK